MKEFMKYEFMIVKFSVFVCAAGMLVFNGVWLSGVSATGLLTAFAYLITASKFLEAASKPKEERSDKTANILKYVAGLMSNATIFATAVTIIGMALMGSGVTVQVI